MELKGLFRCLLTVKAAGIFIISAFLSCSPVRQVLRSPEKTQIVVDEYLKHYPPLVTDTQYIKLTGDSSVNIVTTVDTVVADHYYDSVTTLIKTIYRTVHKTDTIQRTIIDRTLVQSFQRNNAALQTTLDQKNKDLSNMKTDRNKYRLLFFLLAGICTLGISFFLYNRLK